MFGVILYLGICVVAALVLTFLGTLFRKVGKQGEGRSWVSMLLWTLFLFGAPFAYSEILTAQTAAVFSRAVHAGVRLTDVKGNFEFFRVVGLRGEEATALAVVTEKPEWGGRDRVVVRVEMRQKQGKWLARSAEVMTSIERHIDRLTIPPYR